MWVTQCGYGRGVYGKHKTPDVRKLPFVGNNKNLELCGRWFIRSPYSIVYTPYLRKYPKITKNTLKGEQKSCYKIGLDYHNIYLHLNGVRYNWTFKIVLNFIFNL